MKAAFIILFLLLFGKDSGVTNSVSQENTKIWRGGNIKPFIYNEGSVTEGQIISRNHIATYKSWGINVLRVQMHLDKSSSYFASSKRKQRKKHNSDGSKSSESLAETYGKYLEGLDSVSRYCAELDLDFYISLHGVKNRFDQPDSLYSSLEEFWVYIAKKYKDHKNFIGYDVLNEPITDFETNELYDGGLFNRLVTEIRRVDTTKYIIAEGLSGGGPKGFENIKPLDDKKVIYSFHFYEPHQFTYQGMRGYLRVNKSYPGKIKPDHEDELVYYDKERLKEELHYVRKFQLEHNVPIMVGEFSAVRWAPNSELYLKDCMEIFEEYGWHWTFQALFAEWNGWCITIPDSTESHYGYGIETIHTKRFEEVSNYWKLNLN